MGRNYKQGLDYFPMDTDIFQDIRIRKLIKRQGGKAVAVYTLLLCTIYRNGYYIVWDQELPFIFSELTGFDEAYILEVFKSCLSLGLFDKGTFDRHNVVTSAAIQVRYIRILQSLRRTAPVDRFNLIDDPADNISSEETPISSEEIVISSEEIVISSEETPISSVQKERKRKEIKRKKETTSPKKVESSSSWIFDYFNKAVAASGIPPVRSRDGIHAQLAAAAAAAYTPDGLRRAIDKAVATPFLNGGAPSGFRADFRWIFTPANLERIITGFYDPRPQPPPAPAAAADPAPAERARRNAGRQQAIDAERARNRAEQERYLRRMADVPTVEPPLTFAQYSALQLDDIPDEDWHDTAVSLADPARLKELLDTLPTFMRKPVKANPRP